MNNLVFDLGQQLLLDSDYIEYVKLYDEKKIIERQRLIRILDKYEVLYIIFLKINILIYNYDTSGLNNELKDYLHFKGGNYYIEDLSVILKYYSWNYSRCRKTLKTIIVNKLRPVSEIRILKKIVERPISDEIISFFDDENLIN